MTESEARTLLDRHARDRRKLSDEEVVEGRQAIRLLAKLRRATKRRPTIKARQSDGRLKPLGNHCLRLIVDNTR